MTLSAEQLARKNQEQKAKTMAEFEKEFSFAAKHRNQVGGYYKPVHDLWIGYCTGRVVGYTAALRDNEAVVADYEEVLADKRRLTRELDVIMNGEDGAAKQASLCDIVAQLPRLMDELRALRLAVKEE